MSFEKHAQPRLLIFAGCIFSVVLFIGIFAGHGRWYPELTARVGSGGRISIAEEPELPLISRHAESVEPGMQTPVAVNARLVDVLKNHHSNDWPGELYMIAGDMGVSALRELLSATDSHWPEGFRKAILLAVHDRWLELDPAAAVRSADQGGVPEESAAWWLDLSFRLWAARSPDEVFSFLQNTELTHLSRENCYGALARGAAVQGSRSGVDRALMQVHDPAVRSLTIRQIVPIWVQTKDETFLDSWLSSLPEKDRPLAFAETAVKLAAADPGTAVIRLDRLKSADTELFYQTVPRVLVQWARQDPDATAAWFAEQRFDPVRADRMLPALLRVWLRQDQVSPVNWLAACQNKGLFDEAFIRRVVEKL